jgi:hypothetical protein
MVLIPILPRPETYVANEWDDIQKFWKLHHREWNDNLSDFVRTTVLDLVREKPRRIRPER